MRRTIVTLFRYESKGDFPTEYEDSRVIVDGTHYKFGHRKIGVSGSDDRVLDLRFERLPTQRAAWPKLLKEVQKAPGQDWNCDTVVWLHYSDVRELLQPTQQPGPWREEEPSFGSDTKTICGVQVHATIIHRRTGRFERFSSDCDTEPELTAKQFDDFWDTVSKPPRGRSAPTPNPEVHQSATFLHDVNRVCAPLEIWAQVGPRELRTRLTQKRTKDKFEDLQTRFEHLLGERTGLAGMLESVRNADDPATFKDTLAKLREELRKFISPSSSSTATS